MDDISDAAVDVTHAAQSNDIESAASIASAIGQTLSSVSTSLESDIQQVLNITTTVLQSLINDDKRISSSTQDKTRVCLFFFWLVFVFFRVLKLPMTLCKIQKLSQQKLQQKLWIS